MNGAIAGAKTSNFNGTVSNSYLPYARFFDTSYPTLTWPGGCTPDYAVIDLSGLNDSSISMSLATYQSNVLSIISNLNQLGIYKIYFCTSAPATNGAGGSGATFVTWASGYLKAAVTAGTPTSLTITGPATNGTAPYVVGPPGSSSNPGVWGYGGLTFYLGSPEAGNVQGPFPNAGSIVPSGSGTLTLTFSSNTKAVTGNGFAVGDMVLMVNEYFRRTYNTWIRQGIPGVSGVVDLEYLSQLPSARPLCYTDPKWFSTSANSVHPQDPGIYEVWAQSFAQMNIGI